MILSILFLSVLTLASGATARLWLMHRAFAVAYALCIGAGVGLWR